MLISWETYHFMPQMTPFYLVFICVDSWFYLDETTYLSHPQNKNLIGFYCNENPKDTSGNT